MAQVIISKKIFSILLCSILLISVTACGVTWFENGKNNREKVVDLILNGEAKIAENGCVVLPNDLKNLSNTGQCVIVEFQEQSALYFYTFRGILGASRGYICYRPD